MNKMNLEDYVNSEKKLIDREYEIISKLMNLRINNNMSQTSLASIINTTQAQIFRIENSMHSPRLNTLLKILNVYGYTIEIKKIK